MSPNVPRLLCFATALETADRSESQIPIPYPPTNTFLLPVVWLPCCPHDWQIVASPMRITDRPLQKTIALPATLVNTPPCGQFVVPVSLSRCRPFPLTNTLPLVTLTVPVRPCGQHGSPLSHAPVVSSPSLTADGITSPPQFSEIVFPLITISPVHWIVSPPVARLNSTKEPSAKSMRRFCASAIAGGSLSE